MKTLSRHNIQIIISSENEDEKRELLNEIERIIKRTGNCKVVKPGLYQHKLKYTNISLKQLSMMIDSIRLDTNVSRPVNAIVNNDGIKIQKTIMDGKYEYKLEMRLLKDSYMIFNDNTVKEELYLPEKVIMNIYIDRDVDPHYINESIIPKLEKRLLTLSDLFSKNNILLQTKYFRNKGEK